MINQLEGEMVNLDGEKDRIPDKIYNFLCSYRANGKITKGIERLAGNVLLNLVQSNYKNDSNTVILQETIDVCLGEINRKSDE
jgi:hypothetical protein